MKVELVYGDANKQVLKTLELHTSATVQDAILASDFLEQFPELKLSELIVGIFSKKCSLDSPLKSGDRVEIYRPLIIDPKEARRLRAGKKLKSK